MHFGQAVMGYFFFDKALRHHPDYFSTFLEHGIGQDLHQSDIRPSINQA